MITDLINSNLPIKKKAQNMKELNHIVVNEFKGWLINHELLLRGSPWQLKAFALPPNPSASNTSSRFPTPSKPFLEIYSF